MPKDHSDFKHTVQWNQVPSLEKWKLSTPSHHPIVLLFLLSYSSSPPLTCPFHSPFPYPLTYMVMLTLVIDDAVVVVVVVVVVGVVVIASKGQPMSVSFSFDLPLCMFASEVEALAVSIDASGGWLPQRFDLGNTPFQ